LFTPVHAPNNVAGAPPTFTQVSHAFWVVKNGFQFEKELKTTEKLSYIVIFSNV
jgi:hypothetical protein